MGLNCIAIVSKGNNLIRLNTYHIPLERLILAYSQVQLLAKLGFIAILRKPFVLYSSQV